MFLMRLCFCFRGFVSVQHSVRPARTQQKIALQPAHIKAIRHVIPHESQLSDHRRSHAFGAAASISFSCLNRCLWFDWLAHVGQIEAEGHRSVSHGGPMASGGNLSCKWGMSTALHNGPLWELCFPPRGSSLTVGAK